GRDRPRAVAIAGGDGTVTHTVTALAEAMQDQLPPLALLGGGSYDSLAPLGGRGDAEERLKKLSEAVATGAPLTTTERDSIRVLLPSKSAGRCALLFGRPARRDRLLEAVAEEVELRAPRPFGYFLDGEIDNAPGRLIVRAGPRVALVHA